MATKTYPTRSELVADGIKAVTIMMDRVYDPPCDGYDGRWISRGFKAYGWGRYPRESALAGQTRKLFLGSFPTVHEAREAFPYAAVLDTPIPMGAWAKF